MSPRLAIKCIHWCSTKHPKMKKAHLFTEIKAVCGALLSLHWQEAGDAPSAKFCPPAQVKGSHQVSSTAPQTEEQRNLGTKAKVSHGHHGQSEGRTQPPEVAQQGFWPKNSISFSPQNKVAVWKPHNHHESVSNTWPLNKLSQAKRISGFVGWLPTRGNADHC